MPTSKWDPKLAGAGNCTSSKLADRIRREQVDGAARLAPFSALVSGSVVPVVTATAWDQGPRWYLLSLFFFMEALVAVTLIACSRWHRIEKRGRVTKKAVSFAVIDAALLGLLWGFDADRALSQCRRQ